MRIQDVHKAFVSKYTPLLLTVLLFVSIRFFGDYEWKDLQVWITCGLQLLIALLLSAVVQKFVIIRESTHLTAILYLLFCGAFPSLFQEYLPAVYALGILICCYFLFSTYQSNESQGNALNISILLGTGSLFWPPVLYLYPVFWIGMYNFKSLNIRTFSASLIGFAAVYLFLACLAVYKQDLDLVKEYFLTIPTVLEFNLIEPDIQVLIPLGLISLFLIISGWNIWGAGVSEKIRSVKYLSFLFIFSLVTLIFAAVQNQWEREWLSLAFPAIAILTSHFFTLTKRREVMWTFLVFFTLFTGFTIYNALVTN